MMIKSIRVSFYLFFGGIILLMVSSYSQSIQNQSNPYKQIRIPLNMQSRVPFSKDDNGEYYIEGFDIDSSENFYFLGGKKAVLACFSKNGRGIYRKSYLDHTPGQIYIVGDKLYFFEIGEKALNTLVEIDKINGMFLRDYPNAITKVLKANGYTQIDYYEFKDSILHITYLDGQGIEKTKKICFDLKGELKPNCAHHTSTSAAIESEMNYEFLGKMGNNYVLGKFDDDGLRYDLSLRDSSNAVISDSFIQRSHLGKPLCGHLLCMPPEHRKMRGNKLYMLYRDKNMAVINVIDLRNIFSTK